MSQLDRLFGSRRRLPDDLREHADDRLNSRAPLRKVYTGLTSPIVNALTPPSATGATPVTPTPTPTPVDPAVPVVVDLSPLLSAWMESLEERLIERLGNKGYFSTVIFTATDSELVIRPEEDRKYLYLQNISSAGSFIIGFGASPSNNNGIFFGPGAEFEPRIAARNEIRVVRSGGFDCQGMLIYVTDLGT